MVDLVTPNRGDKLTENNNVATQRWITFFEALTDIVNNVSQTVVSVEDDITAPASFGQFASTSDLRQLERLIAGLGMMPPTNTRELETLIAGFIAPPAVKQQEQIIDELKSFVLALVEQRTRWRGAYQSGGLYFKNDEVTDNGWLMIANKKTADRPAPQANGDALWLLPDVPSFATQSNLSVINSGHRYLFTDGVWSLQIRVWLPTVSPTIEYKVVVVNQTDPANPIVGVTNVLNPVANAWVNVAFGNSIIVSGSDFRVYLNAVDSGANTIITGGWAYGGRVNNNPALAEWNTDNPQTTFRIDKTDLDTVDRSSELLSVIPNTTIRCAQTNDLSKYFEFLVTAAPVDAGSFVQYAVTLTDTVNGGVDVGETSTLTITVPTPSLTDYSEWVGYLAGNQPPYATVTGFLEYDGVDQGGHGNDAYGIDVLIQPAQVSEDWDFKAYSN